MEKIMLYIVLVDPSAVTSLLDNKCGREEKGGEKARERIFLFLFCKLSNRFLNPNLFSSLGGFLDMDRNHIHTSPITYKLRTYTRRNTTYGYCTLGGKKSACEMRWLNAFCVVAVVELQQ